MFDSAVQDFSVTADPAKETGTRNFSGPLGRLLAGWLGRSRQALFRFVELASKRVRFEEVFSIYWVRPGSLLDLPQGFFVGITCRHYAYKVLLESRGASVALPEWYSRSGH